jgi:hypothetical protein
MQTSDALVLPAPETEQRAEQPLPVGRLKPPSTATAAVTGEAEPQRPAPGRAAAAAADEGSAFRPRQ